jgi:GxxExxY protein
MGLELEKETYAIIGAAMDVHTHLGSGYLEAVYHEAMEIEMSLRGIPFISEPTLRVAYKDRVLKKHYIPDFVAFGRVIMEIKAHSTPLGKGGQRQILNSLKCSGKKVGLLLNFGRDSLEHKRIVV